MPKKIKVQITTICDFTEDEFRVWLNSVDQNEPGFNKSQFLSAEECIIQKGNGKIGLHVEYKLISTLH